MRFFFSSSIWKKFCCRVASLPVVVETLLSAHRSDVCLALLTVCVSAYFYSNVNGIAAERESEIKVTSSGWRMSADRNVAADRETFVLKLESTPRNRLLT